MIDARIGTTLLMPCLLGGLILWLTGACRPAEGPIDTRPQIEILAFSPDTLRSFQDTLWLEIGYDDVDGDLGAHDPDEKPLWIKDSRLADADLFHVKPLTPDGEVLHIRGSLLVSFPNMFVISTDSVEIANFRVKIQDRSGQWSNEAVSPPVRITR